MKTKKIILALLLIVSTSLNSFADIRPKDVEELKKRKFVVCMLEEQDEALQALAKDPVKLKEYMKKIADYNTYVKKAFTKYWKQHTSIEYKTRSEMQKIINDPELSKKYAYVTLFKWFIRSAGDTKIWEDTSPFFKSEIEYKDRYNGNSINLDMEIYFAEAKRYRFTGVEFANNGRYTESFEKERDFLTTYCPTEGEIYNAVNLLNSLVDEYGKDRNPYLRKCIMDYTPLLNGRMVYLLKDQVDSKVDPSKDFEGFPFKIKIVDKNEIEKLMVKPDPNFAFARYMADGVLYFILPEKGQYCFVTYYPITVKSLKKSIKYYTK